jgi:hypothetical protein
MAGYFMKNSCLVFYALTIFVVVCGIVYSQDGSGLNSIKSKDLLKAVEIIASEEFDGRLSGSEGYNRSALFASEIFSDLDLIPAGDEGYFQHLTVEYNRIDTPAVFSLVNDDHKHSYTLGEDFVLRGFTGSADFLLPVAFCGYGISAPDLGYDDYGDIDVGNKVVIVFKQSPDWKINGNEWSNRSPREKSRVASEHGARGILFVSKPNDKSQQPLIGSVFHGEGEQQEDFPQLHISIETANQFLDAAGYSIKDCQKRIDLTKKPLSFHTGKNALIKVNAKYEKNAGTMNVVGRIEGSDKQLREEYLIIGAHLDHVGSQAGLLFPGANDNASGSAGVLEMAEAFQISDFKPKRSILFVLFAAEEQGLYGSKYFVKNLNLNSGKIAAMFNFDCIGYGDSIQIGNGKSSPVLWDLASKIDEENAGLMVNETWNGGGADATPFHETGIPCLYFASRYSYDHLHQPTDKPETLNYRLLENLVKLAYLTAREVADGKYIREKVLD